MSHREEPRSGRGCFGAVVVVPFLALGGMFALIALTGSPEEAPLAAPPPTRSTSQWWTEPFDALTTSTVTETVVAEGKAREVRAARMATQARVAVSTVTETVRVSTTATTTAKPAATGRNEVPDDEPPSTSDSSVPPVVTSSAEVPPAPPASSAEPVPPVPPVPPSTPRSEEPLPPSASPGGPSSAPPCTAPVGERAEAGAGERALGAVVVGLVASPAEVVVVTAGE